MSEKRSIKKVFCVQSTFLNILRLWTPYDPLSEHCWAWIFPRILWLIFMIFSIICSIYTAMQAISGIAHGINPRSPVVRSLAGLPNFLLSSRGGLMLWLVASHKLSLQEFIERCEIVVYKCIPSEQRQTTKWLLISLAMSTFCLFVFCAMFTLSWLHGLEFEHRTLNTDYELTPFRVAIPVWSFIVLQSLFMYFPYFLSQLIMVTANVAGVIMTDCSRALNIKLISMEQNLQHGVPFSFGLKDRDRLDEMKRMSGQVENLITARAALFQLSEMWNAEFGFMLFLSYFADLGSAAGMLAVLITNAEISSVWFEAKLIGTVGFISFATVLYVPLIMAAETAAHSGRLIYRITSSAYHRLRRTDYDTGTNLRELLDDLHSKTMSHPIEFSAAEFFHMNRKLLATTFTFLVSFGVVLVEFLGRTGYMDEREISANTCNSEQSLISDNNQTLML